MDKIISATDARIHFGELIQEAQNEPITVERGGKPVVVVLSIREYDRLVAGARPANWRERLDEIHQKIRIELVGRELPDPAEVLRQIREERDEQFDLR